MITYPNAIRPLIEKFTFLIHQTLPDQLTGLYIFGSLAIGDFDIQTSDIDLLIVTKNELYTSQVYQLNRMHKNIFHSQLKLCDQLECFYISQQSLKNCLTNSSPCFKLDRGSHSIHQENLLSDWFINMYSLQQKSLPLFGENILKLIPHQSLDQFENSMLQILSEWWLPMAKGNRFSKNLNSLGYRIYAIQTMARLWTTFQVKKIVSKKEALSYFIQNNSGPFKNLVIQSSTRSSLCSKEMTKKFILHTSANLNDFM